MYHYKVIIFQNNIYYVLTIVTLCRPSTQTCLQSIPPMTHSKHFLFLSYYGAGIGHRVGTFLQNTQYTRWYTYLYIICHMYYIFMYIIIQNNLCIRHIKLYCAGGARCNNKIGFSANLYRTFPSYEHFFYFYRKLYLLIYSIQLFRAARCHIVAKVFLLQNEYSITPYQNCTSVVFITYLFPCMCV